mmetsp:Transcript_36518/g.57312  ORF Transcript_36518/g.57312 Transcript_36518/m.57312 type:complete len:114 (+) Transcript_36518:1108-1449(+)
MENLCAEVDVLVKEFQYGVQSICRKKPEKGNNPLMEIVTFEGDLCVVEFSPSCGFLVVNFKKNASQTPLPKEEEGPNGRSYEGLEGLLFDISPKFQAAFHNRLSQCLQPFANS